MFQEVEVGQVACRYTESENNRICIELNVR
jgi:hypothetical protein